MKGLHSDYYQQGEASNSELVLIHGWGAHGGVWQSVLPALLENFNVTCIDLPGHGKSHKIADNSIVAWADAVLEAAPEKAVWLGWSLGGLVAQQIASKAPHRVEKLIVHASTPKFVKSADWSEAVDEKTFRDFHAEVIRDPHSSLVRFIALQTRGSKTASQDSRLLRKTLLEPEPSAAGLDNGMQLLLETDLREKIKAITCPVLVLAGQRDTLIPETAVSEISNLFIDSESNVIKQAGHAAFLSHPEEFCQAVNKFCFDENAINFKEAK